MHRGGPVYAAGFSAVSRRVAGRSGMAGKRVLAGSVVDPSRCIAGGAGPAHTPESMHFLSGGEGGRAAGTARER